MLFLPTTINGKHYISFNLINAICMLPVLNIWLEYLTLFETMANSCYTT